MAEGKVEGEEPDFNDVLDDIVLREQTVHKRSYEEGFEAGSAAGNLEGFHLGYHRGAELGRELGYYLSVVTFNIAWQDLHPHPEHKDKIVNQLTKVQELINSFPKDNAPDQDILAMADTVRAQYKKACALLKISSIHPFVRHNLDSVISFLTPLLPLANCHMVEFVTGSHWDRLLPPALTDALSSMTLPDATESFWKAAQNLHSGSAPLDQWVHRARAHCVAVNNEYCLSRAQLELRLKARGGGGGGAQVNVREFMTPKKSYEVQTMVGLAGALCAAGGAGACVEAGGGRGALLTSLGRALAVPCVTVDCEPARLRAARHRAHKVQKVCPGPTPPPPHRFVAAFVTRHTDLAALVREALPEYGDTDLKILLTGLHTCGDLGADSVRLFAQGAVRALLNAPCCYHLLSEGGGGLPVSAHAAGLKLGRNARMLAAQSLDRVVAHKQEPARSLLYRALLEVIIQDRRPPPAPAPAPAAGKLKRVPKCDTFEQYFEMADSILNLNLYGNLPDNYLENLLKNSDELWKKMVLFYLLRMCLAQVIESAILLDRLLYLYESGFESAFLVKMFDPVLSPRCHGIVAIKDENVPM